jgi:hypothetical protein
MPGAASSTTGPASGSTSICAGGGGRRTRSAGHEPAAGSRSPGCSPVWWATPVSARAGSARPGARRMADLPLCCGACSGVHPAPWTSGGSLGARRRPVCVEALGLSAPLGRMRYVTAEAIGAASPEPRRAAFLDSSAREIRTALTPEDAAAFDSDWRAALTRAMDSLDLAEINDLLVSWRRTAHLTTALGHAGYRQMLARADRVLATGQLEPGTVPVEVAMADLGRRE